MEQLMKSGGMKRRVLIVDDEMINRELLGAMISATYDVDFAENGKDALDKLRAPDAHYSLILLDLLMPVLDGFEVIKACHADEFLRRIPIIVMTSEKSAKVKSIRMGAADFITKPYDMPEVILARCERIIELSEDKSIIDSTERDPLTGLYTRGYFFAYLPGLQAHLDSPMDAMVLNIDRFHMLNELFGREEGDKVLRCVGDSIKAFLEGTRGIACRTEGDNFLIYCEHHDDYEQEARDRQDELNRMTQAHNIHLRIGVYACESDDVDFERCFSRAKAACDRIRGQFELVTTFYDHEIYEKNVFCERLIGDLQDAIDGRQFVVYYQPKYRIQGERPVLASAEALIRWIHPTLGFISPGDFIPLFEKNGLIRKVDRYVWREAAAQIRRWKDTYGRSIPVSVNVSRVDIFDPDLEEKLQTILKDNALNPGDMYLEITESAYSDNADHLIEVVNRLRESGFRIEMDDFGSGYSSLNMLTTIPIDVLKLDMEFIRNMLTDETNEKLVGLMIDIASYLDVPVVAEGVEEREQLDALKQMGCELVQGYYFSPPLPAGRFEELIIKEIKNESEETHDYD
ncbi:MAG: EAL domain-containing protein [Ruminococcus sp.]|nr:EAL domain-containing protein [Ruminococcus sp.]